MFNSLKELILELLFSQILGWWNKEIVAETDGSVVVI